MDDWQYQPAADLDQRLLDRLRRFPREPDMFTYGLRSCAALAVRGWLRAFHRFQVSGAEHIPQSGSFVVVSNHASHLDAVCLMAAMPLRQLHRTFSAAATDYFFVSAPRVAVAVLVVNALPFNRETQVRQSLRLCRELLLGEKGNALVLFPEGSRSADGQVHAFKPGIGLLVAGTDIPVLPCYLRGAQAALPKHAKLPRPRQIRLTIGPPRRYPDLRPDKAGSTDVCQDLHAAVMELGHLEKCARVDNGAREVSIR
jgi:1-acyl-sn-glycerol-3-phosphate acyltransferase